MSEWEKFNGQNLAEYQVIHSNTGTWVRRITEEENKKEFKLRYKEPTESDLKKLKESGALKYLEDSWVIGKDDE